MSTINATTLKATTLQHTNGTTALTINSSGLILTANNPFFMGRPSIDYSSGGAPAGTMGITSLVNNGNHFNSGNSRFTAPITGYYQTTWGGLQLPNGVTSLMVNGVRTYNGNHFVTSPSYITVTQTAVVLLNAGDYLSIEQWNGGGYYLAWWLWSVVLLG